MALSLCACGNSASSGGSQTPVTDPAKPYAGHTLYVANRQSYDPDYVDFEMEHWSDLLAGKDADTNGSICGNLCGAYSGAKAFPVLWRSRVEKPSGLDLKDTPNCCWYANQTF